MWVPRTPPEIILDHVQRAQLEALTRASSASQAEVLRARIILLAALNRTNEEIADELQTTEQTACICRPRSRPSCCVAMRKANARRWNEASRVCPWARGM